MSSVETIRLSGALTMHTVGAVLEQARGGGDWIVDLAEVTEADSAALALLLEWMRRARGRGASISIRSLPAGLRSLADLYDVTGLLPVAP